MQTRVEIKQLKFSPEIDNLCFLSKNLYNYVNYLVREIYFYNSKHPTIKKKFPTAYELVTQLSKENQVDYRQLPAQTSQQIIMLLMKNWKSFFAALRAYNKSSTSFTGRPKLPKYKDKVKGRNVLIFTNQQVTIKDGFLHFPKKTNLQPLRVKSKTVQQIRILPNVVGFKLELVYKKEVTKELPKLNSNRFVGIDLGVNNFATCVSNQGKSMLLKGGIIKSANQYFNKKLANLKSILMTSGVVKDVKFATSKRIKKLNHNRNNIVNNFLHHSSRKIIDFCIENEIANIVIGNNKLWKQNIKLGKRNNQNFVQLPFHILIQQITYKAEEVGITVEVTEESYTSKVDHLAKEEMKHHSKYLGKRVKRGLFKSSTGKLINADVNGGIGILRKVIGDDFLSLLVSGQVFCPVKICPISY